MEVYISIERYDHLLKSEHDANQLKALIAAKHKDFLGFTREELEILYTIFCGNEEG